MMALARCKVMDAAIGVAAALLLGCVSYGCRPEKECTTTGVIACAESLVVQDSARFGVAFPAAVSGIVGPTLCSEFEETEIRWVAEDHVELRPRGSVTVCKGTTCPAALREFSDSVMITPRNVGWLRIDVISDCISIVDSVAIRPNE